MGDHLLETAEFHDLFVYDDWANRETLGSIRSPVNGDPSVDANLADRQNGAVHYPLRMEWFWVLLLFAITFGPVILLLVRRGRGEGLSQGPDSLMESYRIRFENRPRWPRV